MNVHKIATTMRKRHCLRFAHAISCSITIYALTTIIIVNGWSSSFDTAPSKLLRPTKKVSTDVSSLFQKRSITCSGTTSTISTHLKNNPLDVNTCDENIYISVEETAISSSTEILFEDLKKRFQGDFDNYDQVILDREAGLLPGPGGGHEHIHCTLLQLPITTNDGYDRSSSSTQNVLAAYYFDGIPSKIFRFRLYQLKLQSQSAAEGEVLMTLFTLKPEVEGALRQCVDPTRWSQIVHSEFVEEMNGGSELVDVCGCGIPLTECEVMWCTSPSRELHAYLFHEDQQNQSASTSIDDAVHAYMINSPVEIDSSMIPGTKLKVMDELSLWSDELWINDRGYDLDGNFVYGNQRGIPYAMKRVANIKDDVRNITDYELAWTLGSDWRTDDEYKEKMEAIGGVTTRYNK